MQVTLTKPNAGVLSLFANRRFLLPDKYRLFTAQRFGLQVTTSSFEKRRLAGLGGLISPYYLSWPTFLSQCLGAVGPTQVWMPWRPCVTLWLGSSWSSHFKLLNINAFAKAYAQYDLLLPQGGWAGVGFTPSLSSPSSGLPH